VRALDTAIAQLPSEITAGHHEDENGDLVHRALSVRADSAGCTEGFLEACRARNVGFFVSARKNTQLEAAIFDAIGIEEVWLPSLGQDGKAKDGSSVEVTSLIDHAKLPAGTRLIVRRERLHPGAQRSLFPSMDFRCWVSYTGCDGVPRDLGATMRVLAYVEQHICRLKDLGLCRFPFTDFEANTAWMMTVALSADLVCWFQGSSQPASGKTRDPKRCAGPSSTRPADSCAAHAGTSCASSTAGQPSMCSSTPNGASHCSPDHRQMPFSRHSLNDARPSASPGSDSTPQDGFSPANSSPQA